MSRYSSGGLHPYWRRAVGGVCLLLFASFLLTRFEVSDPLSFGSRLSLSSSSSANRPWHQTDLEELALECPNQPAVQEKTLVIITGTRRSSLDAISQALKEADVPIKEWPTIPQETLDSLLWSIHSLDYDVDTLPRLAKDAISRSISPLSGIYIGTEPTLLLPFLSKFHPSLTLIHIVDSVDIAVNDESSMTWDVSRLLMGMKASLDVKEPGEVRLAAAKSWALVNLGIRSLARKTLPCSYHIFRAEDLCSASKGHARTTVQDLSEVLTHTSYLARGSVIHLDCSAITPTSLATISPHTSAGRLLGPLPTAFGYESFHDYLPEDKQRQGITRHVGTSSRLTLITLGEKSSELFNWLLHYRDAGATSSSPILIATPSSSLNIELQSRGFPSIYYESRGDSRGQYWLWRLSVLDDLVARGYDVLLSDLDAVWAGNAWSLIPLAGDGVDVVGSRGLATHMRASARDDVTASLCMGLAHFSASAGSRSILHNALLMAERVEEPDDQVAVNAVLARFFDLRWDPNDSAVHAPGWAHGSSFLYPALKVAMIPHHLVVRDCGAPSMSEEGRGGVVVIHCYHPGEAKEDTMRSTGMWRLKDDWETWYEALPRSEFHKGSGFKWKDLMPI